MQSLLSQLSQYQLSLDFEAIRGLDEQLDKALDYIGVGKRDWNGALEERFLFWLHIHVLQDAVNVIADSRGGKALRTEAAEWLFSEETGPFSFRSISRLLGADSGDLLEKVVEKPKVRHGLAVISH